MFKKQIKSTPLPATQANWMGSNLSCMVLSKRNVDIFDIFVHTCTSLDIDSGLLALWQDFYICFSETEGEVAFESEWWLIQKDINSWTELDFTSLEVRPFTGNLSIIFVCIFLGFTYNTLTEMDISGTSMLSWRSWPSWWLWTQGWPFYGRF